MPGISFRNCIYHTVYRSRKAYMKQLEADNKQRALGIMVIYTHKHAYKGR